LEPEAPAAEETPGAEAVKPQEVTQGEYEYVPKDKSALAVVDPDVCDDNLPVIKNYNAPKLALMDSHKYAVEIRYRAHVGFWEGTIKAEKLKENAAKVYKAGRCMRKLIIIVVVGGLLGFIGY